MFIVIHHVDWQLLVEIYHDLLCSAYTPRLQACDVMAIYDATCSAAISRIFLDRPLRFAWVVSFRFLICQEGYYCSNVKSIMT